jgi:hypothetical membrane protein
VNTTIPTRAGTRSTAAELTADRVTKSLLGYGVIAGPIYVVVSLAQALTRDGFDLTRHAWSQLALGGPGWVQTTNLVVCGLMLVAFAVGLRRALGAGPAATWSPVLIAVLGLSMVVSGIFPVDPMLGFPVGAPAPVAPTAGALVHLAAGAVGFVAATAGVLVLARRLAAEGFHRLALAGRIVAPFFLATFVGLASGALGAAGVLAFAAGVVAIMALISALARHRYRQMPDTTG